MEKRWLILPLFLLLNSCLGPKIAVCIVDISGLQCHDQRTNKDFVVSIQDASDKNYIAVSPDDFARLLDYAKNKSK